MRALACLAILLAACTVGDPDEEPDDVGDADGPADVIENATTIDEASIAQVNPFFGGKFSDLDENGTVTYKTAHRLGAYIATKWPRLSLIGMEEITSEANAQMIAQILSAETGHTWAAQHFGRGTQADALPATQEAILWRTDIWTPGEVFGTRQVEVIDTPSRGPASYSIRFGGMMLHRNGTNHDLAMFAGKLTWLAQKRNGHLITNDDRATEVNTLMAWIDDKLAAHPNVTRVIAMDVNADYHTAPWQRLRLHYRDGGDDRPTHWQFGARRIDGLFWDYDAGPKRSDAFGFVGGPYRSANFGSDHRAVAARVKLR